LAISVDLNLYLKEATKDAPFGCNISAQAQPVRSTFAILHAYPSRGLLGARFA
jgi:hypothetical protein